MRAITILVLGLGALGLAIGAGARAQEVSLPLDRYDELWARAHPEPAPAAPPAVPVALAEARLEIVLDPAGARVVQELVVALQDAAWQRFPLPAIGSFVAADFGAVDGRLTDGELRVRGASGRHRIRLEAALEMTRDEASTRPTWSLELTAPAAALVTGKLTVRPGFAVIEQIEAVGPALLLDDGKRFLAAPGESFGFILRGPATVPERALLPLRFEAISANRLEISRQRRQLASQIAIEVLQGRLEEARLVLPPGFEVVDVRGAEIAGWRIEDGHLVVTALTVVDEALRFTVELAGELAAEFRSPLLEVTGAARQFLASRIVTERDALLSLLDPGGARQPGRQELDRLPPNFATDRGWALIVPEEAAPPSWQVLWPEGTEVLAAQVDRLLIDAALGENGRAAYQVWAEVRSSGAPRLVLDLPGAELMAAYRDGAPIDPGRDQDGWVVPLAAPHRAGEAGGHQVIHLQFLLPLSLPAGDGELAVPMPALSAPAARIEVRLGLPGARRYRFAEAGRAGRAAPPPSAARRRAAPQVSQQLGLTRPAEPTARRIGFWPPISGAVTLQASWSALSATPGPLVVEIDSQRRKEEWF